MYLAFLAQHQHILHGRAKTKEQGRARHNSGLVTNEPFVGLKAVEGVQGIRCGLDKAVPIAVLVIAQDYAVLMGPAGTSIPLCLWERGWRRRDISALR